MREVTFEELLERKNNYEGISAENQQRIKATYDNIMDVSNSLADNVVLLSDFDADGICSALIMKKIFPEAQVIIGDRFTNGYGVPDVKLNYRDMVICTDIGSSDVMKLAEIATQTSILPYVVDHHEKDKYMIKYEESSPTKVLNFTGEKNAPDYCGTGLALKLYECDYYRKISEGYDKIALDKELNTVKVIGMIGTIADMVKVNNPYDENREIIMDGFKTLKDVFKGKAEMDETLRAFLEVCGVDENTEHLTTKKIGFDVAPCINALGRLKPNGGQKCFDILSSPLMIDENTIDEKVFEGILQIRDVNKERKQIVEDIMLKENIKKAIENGINDNILIIVDRDIPQGVTGLVANKIKEMSDKPCIVLTEGLDGNLVGSGRNMEGYPSLYEYTKSDKCIKQGGHKDAIGLSIKVSDFDDYKEEIIEKYKMADIIEPEKEYLKDAKDFTVDKYLQLEPFGTDFKVPMVKFENVKVSTKYNLPKANPKPEWAITQIDGLKIKDFAKGNVWNIGDKVTFEAEVDFSDYQGEHIEFLVKSVENDSVRELSMDKPKQAGLNR